MRSEWPEVRLGDHVDACLGKMLDVKKNKGTPEPYLGNSNVRWGTFDLVNLAEMRFEPHEEERYGLLSGDLIVCEGGEPGRCAIWTGTNSPRMKIQKALHRIRPKGNLNNYFLYYWFCYAAKAGLLEQHFTGTTIKHLTGKAIAALKIPLPPIEFQMALVDVLKTLDDCIALLRETNATLEAIVQALFKSWFVDFDPVHARARGEQPAGLAPEVAALFPDSFEESALGLVPNGWCWRTMDDVSTVGIGKTPPRKEPQWFSENLDDVPWVSIKDMGTAGVFINNTSEFLTPASIDRFNVRVVPDNTVLLSFKLTVGRLSITDGEMVTNEAIAHFKLGEDSPLSSAYIYLALRQFNFESLSSTSSIAEAVNSKTVRAIPILVPSPSLVTMFNDYANPIFNRIKLLEKQAQTLANLRDTLLPRLISGQLRLPDAEQQLKDLAV